MDPLLYALSRQFCFAMLIFSIPIIYQMISTLFVLFAGIALSIGLIQIWLGFTRRDFKTDFLFGLFAVSAGIYYLCLGLQLPNFKFLTFFAVSMFALFPWYYALELGYVKRNLLWLITGLCAGFYVVILLDLT
ncbi:MAG: hypothetical protein ACR2MM_03065, partial [Flavobacteriaceae bacterium]